MKLDNLVEGVVVKRPSKAIKTPYVADVAFVDSNSMDSLSAEILAHTAALGCCGLADSGAHILMAPMPIPKNKNNKQKCAYRIYLSVLREKGQEMYVGIHPKLAEDLAESALNQNCLSILRNVRNYRRETPIFVEDQVDSRFDFTGVDCNGVHFIMEIKNVPLADYEDITSKDRKNKCYDDIDVNSKVAYFPDGYRKKSTEPVSPRALKHVRELTFIRRDTTAITRCIMCFVIQRTDVDRFQPSIIDPEYRAAVKEALEAGVELITLVVEWTRDGYAYFVRDDLPITSFE
jgi:DNA-binding sugar fermentation-stimulating protein